MHELIAVLAYLPLGFVAAACWLEAVTAAKKTDANQPGAVSILFGAAVVTAIAVALDAALPSESSDSPAGAWPATAPRWASIWGAAAFMLTAAAYAFKLVVRRRTADLRASEEGASGKERVRRRKSLNDLQLGYWFALAAASLMTGFTVLQAPGGHALWQAVAFLPIALVVAACWLEFVISAKNSEAHQPASLSVLFAAALASLAAFGISLIATTGASPQGIDSEGMRSVAPVWKSLPGALAAIFVAGAYFLKLQARNRRLAAPAPGVAPGRPHGSYSYRRNQSLLLPPSLSPASFRALLALGLAGLMATHSGLLSSREDITHMAEAVGGSTSEGISKLKEFASMETRDGTLEKFADREGTLGSLMVAQSEVVEDSRDTTAPDDPGPTDADAPGDTDTPGDEAPADEGTMTEPGDAAEVATIDASMEDAPPMEEASSDGEPALAAADSGEASPAEAAPAAAPAEQPVSTTLSIKPYDGGRFFLSYVKPILSSNCYSCHGSDKKKGGLALHTPEAIRTGGDSGASVIAGNPAKSTLYTSTTLGKDDPDIMPAKGDPLTEREQQILAKWIADGAHMNDGEAATSIAVASASGGDYQVDRAAEGISPPNPAIIQALEQQEVQFRGISSNGALIKVDYSHVSAGTNVNLADLAGIAPNVYHLDLTRRKLGGSDLSPLSKLSNLGKLELNLTGVGNEALTHLQGLTHLESLNLYGTRVDDAGIRSLSNLKSLRKLYVWETGVTKAGAQALEEAIPGLEVVLGL